MIPIKYKATTPEPKVSKTKRNGIHQHYVNVYYLECIQKLHNKMAFSKPVAALDFNRIFKLVSEVTWIHPGRQ
jgi:hypothetical protein